MKKLKIKKIKIAKINNLSMILGGQLMTVIEDCILDTEHTCPIMFTEDPNYISCQHTDLTIAGDPTAGIAHTDRCTGEGCDR